MRWRIYYGDGSVVDGSTREEWLAAPSGDVQVVVADPEKSPQGWTYRDPKGVSVPVRDRRLWTGTDTFDPFGWGEKHGAWMADAKYFATWNRACSDRWQLPL